MTTIDTTATSAVENTRPVVIEIDDISKRFTLRKDNSIKERIVTLGRAGRRHREDFWALKNVSLQIRAGTTIGLIGHNGSGKSTLLKVIGGIIDPTSGSLRRRGRIAALLELGAGFHPDLTGRENVYLNASILGLSREETDERFDDIVKFSGIAEFIDTQVKFYSSGMYVRLAFAVAVHTDPDILLVDEVLAVGDEAFQRKCLDKIRAFQAEGRTIVLVSHSLGQVQELCDRAILLNQGEIVLDGDPREAIADFRDILEGRRLDDLDGEPEASSAHGTIDEVTVRARGRAFGDPVQPGDDVVVSVTFTHPGVIEDWICGIQIDNAMGTAVFSTGSARLGAELGPLRGTRTIELLIKDVRLGTGKYFVNASLMDATGVHLNDLPQAASFDTSDQPWATGIIYAEAEMTDAS